MIVWRAGGDDMWLGQELGLFDALLKILCPSATAASMPLLSYQVRLTRIGQHMHKFICGGRTNMFLCSKMTKF